MCRIVCFGEVLLRLAAPKPQLLLQQSVLEPTFCGAEANVAVALAGFEHDCRLVTALPDNAIGQAARRAISQFSVDVEVASVPASRLGLYFLEPGAMRREARIIYDRAGSAFATAAPESYDWATLLKEADWLVASGITAALGDAPLASLRAAFASARDMGVRIAFDTNFRATLWLGREAQAAAILKELSCEADLLFAGRRATAMMVGGRYDDSDGDAGFHKAAEAMFAQSDHLMHMAATRREVLTSDSQRLTALLADRDGSSASEPIMLEQIVDRVGTGDAFAAGILHGIDAGRSREQTARFAGACAGWAHSVPGDFLRASLADIETLAKGTGDVLR